MIGTFILLIAIAVAMYELGWFTKPQPVEIAEGLRKIPDDQRASGKLPDEIILRWLGHSSFVLRWRGVTILIDPNTAERCTVSHRILKLPADVAKLGRIDAVLITHAHYDHLNIDTLMRIPEIGFTAVPVGSEEYFALAQASHAKPRPVQIGETFRVGEIEITAVTAAHNGDRFHPWRSPKIAVGYVLRSGSLTIYFAGDTAAHNDFAAIRGRFHPDVAILPIGAFSPRRALKIHHLNPEEAVEAALKLGAQTVVPCHFGTFRLSFDRPATALPRFAAEAKRRGISWVMPELLES